MDKLTVNQKKFLDVFALQRFHSIISNLTESGFLTKRFMDVKNGDLDLLKKSESPEEFYKKVFAYHTDKAENLWVEGEKFSPEVFQKLADFLFNTEMEMAEDFSEWAMDSFKAFGGPTKSFEWDKYLNQKIFDVIEKIQ